MGRVLNRDDESVREPRTATKDYPADVIAAWAPPIGEERLSRFLANHGGEIRLVAELNGEPVGIGASAITARKQLL